MTDRRDELEGQVRRLERRLIRSTRFQRGLAVLLLLQLALAAGEQEPVIPEVIRARSLQVVDPEGTPVVLIASDRDGNGGMALYDREGRPLVSLEADRRGAGAVNVMDPDRPAISAAFLGVDPHGDGLAGVRSARDLGGASFGIGVHGAGEFAVYNAAGRRVAAFGGDAHGAGMLRLSDDAQNPAVNLGRTDSGRGVVTVFDETGKAHVYGGE
ncbi:MAG: hypothetical protein H6831_00235 [Planctomycetes bacterium]|nr:hypothetical protein [Planctomycetota bacterium]MCB9902813.1 hypothetical protein [Planctomycetota bacterium]